MIRILFVCMGNICRSPAAEAVFRKQVSAAGLDQQIACDSAGTLDFHTGESADTRMQIAAKERGFELTSIARGFEKSDFEKFDWIVTMDDENYRNIARLATDKASRKKIRPFCDWVSLDNVREVPDPYYGGSRGFETVLNILENGSESLLKWLMIEDLNSVVRRNSL